LDLGRLILKVYDYIALSTVLTPEETTVRRLHSEGGRSSHLLSPSERKYWKEVSEEEVPQERLQSDGGGGNTLF